MSEIKFEKLGADPEYEADLLHKLCTNDGVDDAILSEFPGTIAAYGQPVTENSVNRVRARYTGLDPTAIGDIITLNAEPIGLAYSGIAEYQRKQDIQPQVGINVSTWLLSHIRGRGFANQILNHATSRAMEQTKHPDSPNWHEKRLWTSVRLGNLASKRMCENIGFVNSGLEIDKPGRLIYLFEKNNH